MPTTSSVERRARHSTTHNTPSNAYSRHPARISRGERERRLQHRPQLGANAIRLWRHQLVRCHHPFDHVGQHGHPRSIFHPYRHHRRVRSLRPTPATDRTINAKQPRRRTKPGRLKPHCLHGRANHTHRPRKIDSGGTVGLRRRRCHAAMLPKGCHSHQYSR